MKKILLATTILFGITGTALAADAVAMEEVVVVAPSVFNWTGGYVGGQIGYLWGSGDFIVSPPADPLISADIGPDGFLGGIYVGYNYQMYNNVVLGVDADFAWTGADDSAPAFDPTPVGSVNTDLEWEGAVRARLGYAADRFLPYVAGGVAFGRLNAEGFNPAGVSQGQYSDTSVGWTVGVGLEYAFTDNLIGRAEYRYTDFGTFDGTISGISSSTDFTSNDIRFGIAYKF